jgi:chromosomal replication initiation ATPase DnaA
MATRAREPVQLALALGHPESFAREDFLASRSNADALEMIERWPDWPARTLALVGPPGSGKSHLAAIWAARAGALAIAARALDEAAVPDVLARGAVVVEDVAKGAVNERALFHLINLAGEKQAHLLLTAETAPAALALRIADLASRLRAIPVVTLAPPDDALLRAVLVKLFADRQLAVDESLLVFLERRIERSLRAARAVVAALDREGLRRQRPLTRALAAAILDGREDDAGDEAVMRSS